MPLDAVVSKVKLLQLLDIHLEKHKQKGGTKSKKHPDLLWQIGALP